VPIFPNSGTVEFTGLAVDMLPNKIAAGFLVDSRDGHAFFIMGEEESAPLGHPWTNAAPASGYGPGWIHPNQVSPWSGCRCLGIEVEHQQGTPPLPERVCCVGETCVITTEPTCASLAGVWHPEWETCTPNPCPPPEAVCCVGDICVIASQANCESLGGIWYPDLQSCAGNPCSSSDIEDDEPRDPTPDTWGSIKGLYR
jgi:hypothetical protein